MTNTDPISYPLRLNRYLYLEKICSRREADRLISQGAVLVNGKQAVLGQKIDKTDTVTLSKKAQSKVDAKKYYIAFNKPVGVISHNPGPDEASVDDFVRDVPVPLSPLGRLDKASRGLMLLSNDGMIVDKLLNPEHGHEKEYVVSVDKRIEKNFLTKMQAGVDIEGYRTKPAVISKINPRVFRLVLTEGKKHQIRRMCAALGYQVEDLQRIRIANIRLGNLGTGKYRELQGKELLELMKYINN